MARSRNSPDEEPLDEVGTEEQEPVSPFDATADPDELADTEETITALGDEAVQPGEQLLGATPRAPEVVVSERRQRRSRAADTVEMDLGPEAHLHNGRMFGPGKAMVPADIADDLQDSVDLAAQQARDLRRAAGGNVRELAQS